MASVTTSDPSEVGGTNERYSRMSRSVGQLLYSYLPGKVVDWEDGVAIVQLTSVRFARVWSDAEARLVLTEVADYLDDWRSRGGSVHPDFPDPRAPRSRLTVGEPASIAAKPLKGALICRVCSRLVFWSPSQLRQAGGRGFYCPSCNRRTLRQFGQVFVHGCGELVPIEEYLPWMRTDDNGVFQSSKLPLHCQNCGANAIPEIPAASERARDMKVTCRVCKGEIQDRLKARCPECTKLFIGQKGGDSDEPGPADGSTGTPVARVVMRLVNSRANDAYYARTLSLLRLDKIPIITDEDEEIQLLNSLLTAGNRVDIAPLQGVNRLEELTRQLKEAIARNASSEVARLRQAIVQVATMQVAPSVPKQDAPTTQLRLLPDVERAIKESLVFRTTVECRDAEDVVSGASNATALMLPEIRKRQAALGIQRIAIVDNLPVITAAFGFTRRSDDPTYDEEVLNATRLPTQIRPFYALDGRAARRLDRIDLAGTVPILAKEGEHEGIFLSFGLDRVISWLSRNGIALPDAPAPAMVRILTSLEPIDRYYDDIWKCDFRRMVFGLVHSLSHAAMRVVSRLAGFERTSLSEYILLPLLGTVVYGNASTTKLGRMETVIRDQLFELLDGLEEEAVDCLYDPDCLDRRGACHGCLHSPEICCRAFNHGLSRAFLIGGHRPWLPAAIDERLIGFWE